MCTCLTNEKYEQLQQEYDKVKNNEYKQSYLIEEQKQRIEVLGKTLKNLTLENRHLKGLVALWIDEN